MMLLLLSVCFIRDAVETVTFFLLTFDTIDLFLILEEMPRLGNLGEFELMVLLSVIRLGDNAYGVPISRELEKQRGREVSVGSVYAALERLEERELVSSSLGDPTPERGGKAKRYFRITNSGLREAHEMRRILTRLWRGMPDLKGEQA
jgi:DNA-binding PadR family transcriptional regulator